MAAEGRGRPRAHPAPPEVTHSGPCAPAAAAGGAGRGRGRNCNCGQAAVRARRSAPSCHPRGVRGSPRVGCSRPPPPRAGGRGPGGPGREPCGGVGGQGPAAAAAAWPLARAGCGGELLAAAVRPLCDRRKSKQTRGILLVKGLV